METDNEKNYMEAISSLDYKTADIIKIYISELKHELNQVKGAYEDRVDDIKSYEKELEQVVSIFNDIQSMEILNDCELNERINNYIKGQEIVY